MYRKYSNQHIPQKIIPETHTNGNVILIYSLYNEIIYFMFIYNNKNKQLENINIIINAFWSMFLCVKFLNKVYICIYYIH